MTTTGASRRCNAAGMRHTRSGENGTRQEGRGKAVPKGVYATHATAGSHRRGALQVSLGGREPGYAGDLNELVSPDTYNIKKITTSLKGTVQRKLTGLVSYIN
jgi:hypothetical protein